jgi:uncharacterized protein (TIGR03437 family)
MRSRLVAIAAACSVILAIAQDGEAPPAIAQGGISNFASRMPSQLPSGAVAPGSLIRIRGWRLGPAPLDKLIVRLRRGDTSVETAALSASENEITARLPENAPLGAAMLQVIKNGQASLEWPVTIAESSFGAFSRNRQGWGPGEISNATGVPNSEDRPARPDEAVTMTGTGLGSRARRPAGPQVLVAGRPAAAVRVLGPTMERPGVDTIAFTLPADTPEGCHVPVEVLSAPGTYSNAVTMAVNRDGKPCLDRAAWLPNRTARVATAILVHADLEMALGPTDTHNYIVDAGMASFVETDANAVSPLFLFPPAGTCTTYTGTAGLHSITSPLTALAAMQGKPLEAGPSVTVQGPGAPQLLPPTEPRGVYWGVIGGRPPVPGAKDLPIFLTPGDYRITAPGGSGVGAFRTSVRVAPPLVWQNREQLTEIDRSQGANVTWQSSGKSRYVLIVAMNDDSRSGALGLCACLANAASRSFQIPAYALANIPPMPAHPRGFPLNLVLLAELPEISVTTAAAAGLDRVLSFAISVSARTVGFK